MRGPRRFAFTVEHLPLLSGRHKMAVEYLLQGLSNPQIAVEMAITEQAVSAALRLAAHRAGLMPQTSRVTLTPLTLERARELDELLLSKGRCPRCKCLLYDRENRPHVCIDLQEHTRSGLSTGGL